MERGKQLTVKLLVDLSNCHKHISPGDADVMATVPSKHANILALFQKTDAELSPFMQLTLIRDALVFLSRFNHNNTFDLQGVGDWVRDMDYAIKNNQLNGKIPYCLSIQQAIPEENKNFQDMESLSRVELIETLRKEWRYESNGMFFRSGVKVEEQFEDKVYNFNLVPS